MATKQKSAICAVLTVLLCTAMFLAGCSIDDPDPGSRYEPEPHDYGIWNRETFNRIKHDYLWHAFERGYLGLFQNFFLTGGIWAGYFGSYNGSHALILFHGKSERKFTGQEVTETVAGITFTFPDRARAITIWNNSNFFTLTEAYALNWLTHDDIQTIADIYQTRGIDFGPLPFDDFAYDYGVWNERTKGRFLELVSGYRSWIRYFGVFSGSHVFFTSPTMRGTYQFVTVPVAGFEFLIGNAEYEINVWKNGVFYCLVNAYTLGLLTQNDIQTLHERFTTWRVPFVEWPPWTIIQ